jgi:calcium/calmodulin-dependent protein kinase (CaM kinase) II/calcium-dependent protein kinase
MLENDPNDRLTAKFCKEILLEIDGNNINIEKLIRKQQIMKSFLISTEETPLDKTP